LNPPGVTRTWSQPLWLVALALVAAFVLLNHTAYDGFFQDDELDNLTWAPSTPPSVFIAGLLKPGFEIDNFRPVGHAYFALMGRIFGLDFPPYVTPIFAIHLLNSLLLFLLLRKLRIGQWYALAAVSFFTLSASAFDAYWKPMYVFDLLCTTFSLAAILLYAHRRWVLSFLAFWLAYKAKELAVMLPVMLALYEYWFGEGRFRVLIPFVLASLNFGIQGLLLNPNKNNDYSFRLTLHALERTMPFYLSRFLLFPLSGLALFALAFIRDRRIWFGLAAMVAIIAPLLFLPGRVFEAYTYLPLAFGSIALAAAASHVNPAWGWLALAIWMPFNIHRVHVEQRAALELDDRAFAYVHTIEEWVVRNRDIDTFVYNGAPAGFHAWGVAAAWNLAHHQLAMPAFFSSSPEAEKALRQHTVAFGSWDEKNTRLTIAIRPRL
jgi:hypothetical protein